MKGQAVKRKGRDHGFRGEDRQRVGNQDAADEAPAPPGRLPDGWGGALGGALRLLRDTLPRSRPELHRGAGGRSRLEGRLAFAPVRVPVHRGHLPVGFQPFPDHALGDSERIRGAGEEQLPGRAHAHCRGDVAALVEGDHTFAPGERSSASPGERSSASPGRLLLVYGFSSSSSPGGVPRSLLRVARPAVGTFTRVAGTRTAGTRWMVPSGSSYPM